MSTTTTPSPPKDVTDLKAKVGRDALPGIISSRLIPLAHDPEAARPDEVPMANSIPGTVVPSISIPPSSTSVPPAAVPTPAEWFRKKYPALSERYGDAVEEVDQRGNMVVRDVNEDFLAATLGGEGNPGAPVVFVPSEERFYGYEAEQGIYRPVSEDKLGAKLSSLLLHCARETDGVDTGALAFKLRDSSQMKGVFQRARGILPVEDEYFQNGLTDFIPCANGMLRLGDLALLQFSPQFRRRNKLAVPFRADAGDCPLFLDTLLRPALSEDDLDLLQRWCGLSLTGINMAQKILMVTGAAGTGKGAVIRVLTGIIGATNVVSLRTRHLHERFEVARFLGKTLLYGADVDENFLNSTGAPVLKSLTGGDPITVELKGSNTTPEIVCRFNAVVTCNTLPQIRLEGDADAWRRRLAIVRFQSERPVNPIADLSEQILAQEGPAVLNWMLRGLGKLREEGWRLTMTAQQERVVEGLLGESDSPRMFVREGLVAQDGAQLTSAACHGAYVKFCEDRGWRSMTRKAFGNVVGEIIARQFGLRVRHDVDNDDGTLQRGWRGVRVA